MSTRWALYQRLKQGIATVAAILITAPLKLPPKVVAGAKCAAVFIGLLDALEADGPAPRQPAEAAEGNGDE